LVLTLMAHGALNMVGPMAGPTAASIPSSNVRQHVRATAAFATKIPSRNRSSVIGAKVCGRRAD
jgi:hypothetical protein